MPAIDTKSITSAGTPEVLTTRSVPCEAVLLTAKSTNAGVIYVVDTENTTKKFPSGGLAPGDAVTLPVTNVAVVWVDCSVSGESVDWVAV